MKKKILVIIGIAILLFGASVVPNISGNIEKVSNDKEAALQKQVAGQSGTDVLIDPDPTNILQNEISLDLIPGSPGSPTLLVAAYNDDPYAGGPGLGVSYSTDAGMTWTATQLQYPMNTITGLLMDDMFDPTVTIDTLGNVFVGQISSDINWYSGMYVHKSTTGGVTWLPPVNIALDIPPQSNPDPNFRFNDRCQIKADTYTSSPYTDNIYVTWLKDRGFNMPLPTGDIYFSYSTDNGNTFSVPITINSFANDLANMPNPAVASDGTVYVSWLHYNVWTGGIGTIFLDVSTNGGVTWGPDITVATINLPPLSLTTGAGQPDVVSKGAPVLEVSPNNPNELYITYAADPDGGGPDECDIFFIRSTNGGGVWSAPIRVNDDTTTNDQHLPWMDVKPDGTIDIAWYDRRNDANDKLWDVYIAKSVDGGITFSTNYKINDQNFASPTNPWGTPWMGEYLGLACDSSWAHIVFTSSISDVLGDVYYDNMDNDDMVVPQAAIDCDGDLTWTGVKPGATVTDSFNVSNIGDPGSELDWDITEWPDWGSWTFNPSGGTALKPEDGPVTVQVTVVAPQGVPRVLLQPKDTTYTGTVKVVNLDDPSDFCIIDVSLTTPKNKAFNINMLFLRFLEQHPNIFPILRQLLGL
ncbi:MAG: exo-alpha-sialidase [Thermoplasmatales archaeon]|nr:MAG: exo-alpha-sialidase [Thermoplasmatales archaeon]